MNPTPSPTSVQPHLYFDADRLAALRQACQSGLRKKLVERLAAVARSIMDPQSPVYLDFRERRSPMWTLRWGVFQVLPRMSALALHSALSDDRAAAETARDAVMTMIEHRLADQPALAWGMQTQGWRHGPGHDKALHAMTVCTVYDLCGATFSDDQRAQLLAYVRESITLADEHREFDTAQVVNNRGSRGLLAPAWFCATFGEALELPDLDARIARGWVALEKFMDIAFDAQGAPYEGPGYAGGFDYHAISAHILGRRLGIDFLKHRTYGRFAQYLLYELLPGGWGVNNLNDASLPAGSMAGCLPAMNQPGGEILPWLAHQLDLHPERAEAWFEADAADGDLDVAAFTERGLLPWLLWWDDSKPIRTPQQLGYPPSHGFMTRGVASMRTGWGDEDWLLSHFCGRQEIYCHRQGDQNHLAFYAGAEHFLVDAGYGRQNGVGDSTAAKDPWYKHTVSHNTAMAADHEQRGVMPHAGWGQGEMLEFISKAGFDTSLGDAAGASGPDHTLDLALRRTVLVRTGPIRFVVVIDAMQVDGQPFEMQVRWTTAEENTMTLHEGGLTLEGQERNCHMEVLWPGPGDFAIAQRDDHGRPQAIVSTRATLAEMVTVLYPMHPGSQKPKFECRQLAPRWFEITATLAGETARVQAGTILEGPMRRPRAVTVTTR